MENVSTEKMIPCLGRSYRTDCGEEFDCDYPQSGDISCENCVCNGGKLDPRIGIIFEEEKKTKKTKEGGK